MALTTDPWDSTELVAYINEQWPGIVDKKFFAKPVAANFFRDLTPEALAGRGDKIHIPDAFTNSFTVQTQSTQGAEVTTNAPATVDTTLTVSSHYYLATLLGDLDAQQIAASYNISEIYNDTAANELVKKLEASLFGLWSSVTTNTIGDTASVIGDSEIRQALEKLESADVPRDELAWFVHPLIASGCKILSNGLGSLFETTRAKKLFDNFALNDLTRGLAILARCESLNSMAT